MPSPGVRDDGFEAHALRHPAKLLANARRRGVQGRGIAGSPGRRREGYAVSRHPLDGSEHLSDRGGPLRSHVVGTGCPSLEEPAQRSHVRIREIRHVHVVSNARAIGGGIVLAKQLERRPALRGVQGAGDEMDLRIVVLAELPVRIRARRIEVPKADRPDAVSTFEMRERLFHGQFCLTVRTDGHRRGVTR